MEQMETTQATLTMILKGAVKSLQIRYRLYPDGVIGRDTVDAINKEFGGDEDVILVQSYERNVRSITNDSDVYGKLWEDIGVLKKMNRSIDRKPRIEIHYKAGANQNDQAFLRMYDSQERLAVVNRFSVNDAGEFYDKTSVDFPVKIGLGISNNDQALIGEFTISSVELARRSIAGAEQFMIPSLITRPGVTAGSTAAAGQEIIISGLDRSYSPSQSYVLIDYRDARVLVSQIAINYCGQNKRKWALDKLHQRSRKRQDDLRYSLTKCDANIAVYLVPHFSDFSFNYEK